MLHTYQAVTAKTEHFSKFAGRLWKFYMFTYFQHTQHSAYILKDILQLYICSNGNSMQMHIFLAILIVHISTSTFWLDSFLFRFCFFFNISCCSHHRNTVIHKDEDPTNMLILHIFFCRFSYIFFLLFWMEVLSLPLYTI